MGDLFVVSGERVEALLEGVEVWEVVGGEDLALDDGEEDLGLVEPARVERGVHEGQVRPGALETVDRAAPRCAEPLSTITNTRWALR